MHGSMFRIHIGSSAAASMFDGSVNLIGGVDYRVSKDFVAGKYRI
jgi:hypothetical protein